MLEISLLSARAHWEEGQRAEPLKEGLTTLLQGVVPPMPDLMGTGGQLAFLDFRVQCIHQTGLQPASWTQTLLSPAQSFPRVKSVLSLS